MIRWLIAAPALLFALPIGMEGPAKIESSGQHLSVTVGDRACLKWQGFSIGKGESVHFAQPGAKSVVINHVVGGEISQILGKLSAKGSVYLVNPSGIFLGKEALVDVGSFIASTMQGIGDRVEERYHLKDSQGKVTIDGKIVARSGDVIVASHHIECSGEIVTQGGAALAAGREIIIQPGKGARAFVRAIGGQRLTSDGNLYSLAINQKGVVDGEVIIRGSMGAKEVIISTGEAKLFGEVRAEKIDCRAITSLASTGVWSGKEISLHSGGSLSLGRVDLTEGGSIALQMRHVDLARLSPVIGALLHKGGVTLVGESIHGGDFSGFGEVFASNAPNRLRLEGRVVTFREGVSLARDFEVKAKDLTIGADDHGASAPLIIESKEGKIELQAERLRLFDGGEKTSLCAKEMVIRSGDIAIIAEGKGCDLHADELLKIVGPGDLLVDARGAKSEIALRANGIAFKDIQKSSLITHGRGAQIQVRAESALGMQGGSFEGRAQGVGSSIEWSAPQIALHVRDFALCAEGVRSKVELMSGALQLLTDKTLTLAALGRESLVHIALTTGGQNVILAGDDLICKGTPGEVQIANLGGASGLILYAGRDLTLESRALLEIREGDLALEAGRDLIFRDRPRFIAQKQEGPAVQLLGSARGERRGQALTFSDLFERIAAREKDAALAFSTFADQLVYPKAPNFELAPPFLTWELQSKSIDLESGIAQMRAHVAKECRCIEHVLCRSLRELGVQGKFAATVRRSRLKEPAPPTAGSRARPWRASAEVEREGEPLAADID